MKNKYIDLTAICCYASDKSVPKPIPYIDDTKDGEKQNGEWCILFHGEHKDVEENEFHFNVDEWNEKYAPLVKSGHIQVISFRHARIGLNEDGETESLEIMDNPPSSSEVQ